MFDDGGMGQKWLCDSVLTAQDILCSRIRDTVSCVHRNNQKHPIGFVFSLAGVRIPPWCYWIHVRSDIYSPFRALVLFIHASAGAATAAAAAACLAECARHERTNERTVCETRKSHGKTDNDGYYYHVDQQKQRKHFSPTKLKSVLDLYSTCSVRSRLV